MLRKLVWVDKYGDDVILIHDGPELLKGQQQPGVITALTILRKHLLKQQQKMTKRPQQQEEQQHSSMHEQGEKGTSCLCPELDSFPFQL